MNPNCQSCTMLKFIELKYEKIRLIKNNSHDKICRKGTGMGKLKPRCQIRTNNIADTSLNFLNISRYIIEIPEQML